MMIDYIKAYPLRIFYWLLVAVTAVLGGYLIINDAQWVFSDEHEWWVSTAIGKFEVLSAHVGGGRFVPLGHYDFNFLTLLFDKPSALVHYIWVALSFLVYIFVLSLFFYKVTKQITKNDSNLVFAMAALFLVIFNTNIVRLFMSIIFPERILVVCLALFMLFSYLAEIKNKTLYYVLAFLTAVYATYCKEPVSSIFVVIGCLNLMFNYKNLTLKQKVFYSGLLFNGILYITLYYFLVYVQSTSFYSSGSDKSLSYFEVTKILLKSAPIYWLFFAVAIYRGICVLFLKQRQYLFFDGLLFASIAYFLAYVAIKFYQPYYIYPGIVLAVPAIFYWGVNASRCFWVKLILFASVVVWVFCGECQNIYQTVKDYQYARHNDFVTFQKMADHVMDGDKIYFYQFPEKIYKKSKYNIYFHWRYVVSERFLNYILDTQDQKYLIVVDSFEAIERHGGMGEHDILLCPGEYVSEQVGRDFISQLLENMDVSLAKNLSGTQIYKKVIYPEISLNQKIFFSQNDWFKLVGFSTGESWGRWTNQKKSSITLKIASVSADNLKIILDVQPFLAANQTQLDVEVEVNGKKVSSWHFDAGKPYPDTSIIIHKNDITEDGKLKLSFGFSNDNSPKDLGLSEDVRKINLGFKSLMITEMP